MSGSPVPKHQGWFDSDVPDPDLTVDLILIERCVGDLSGPWKVSGALVREPGNKPVWVDGWVDEIYESDAGRVWEYLEDRDGGNAYTWEVAYLRIGSISDAPALAAHHDARRAEQGNPLGLFQDEPPPQVLHETDSPEPVPSEDPENGEDLPTDPCLDHTHVNMPLAAADALTWRLAVELVRRHPDDLWILRTYPFDGFYDCLSIRRLPDVLSSPSIALNRNGTHVKVSRFDTTEDDKLPLMSWGDAYAAPDPRGWIRDLERVAGLKAPKGGLPPSTRSSIVLRWIAAFLAVQTGSRRRWTAWNDWAELDEEQPAKCFQAIPEAGEWLRTYGSPKGAALVWFLGHRDETGQVPSLALSVEGHLWRPDQQPVDLIDAYRRAGSSITATLVAVAGDLLP